MTPDPELNAAVETVLNTSWPMPLWLTIVIAASLLTFFGVLYASERGTAGRRTRLTLTVLRFSLLAIVIWMLAGWSWIRFKSDRPELVIAVDYSASMDTRDVPGVRGTRKAQTRMEYARFLFDGLSGRERKTLTQQYQLKWFAIADSTDPLTVDILEDPQPLQNLAANGTQSRLGDTLSRLIDRQAGRGTAAILLISDGINTSGATLTEAAQKARRAAIPIHTVVVGQQFVRPDLRLVDLLIDREIYLGDQVTAEVSVIAANIPPTATKITLKDTATDKLLDTASIELSPNRNQQHVRLSFVPDRSGEIPLQLTVEAVEGEADRSNNTLQASVVVQDKSIRVLMVYRTASYEFRFLKSLLERTRQEGEVKTASFELQSVLQDADPNYVDQDATALRLVPSGSGALADFDVFIFGEFDPSLVSRSSQQAIFEAVTNGGSGCIFVYGSGAPAAELQNWPLGKLLPIESSSPAGRLPVNPQGFFRWQPTSLGATALPMQLSGSPAQSLELWQQLPPLGLKASADNVKAGAQVLAEAIDVQSGEASPLLITQFAGAGRTALQATDETYRWTSFAGSDVIHQRYWGQMLRWLSRGKLSGSDEKSEVLVDPKQARLGQPVRLQARLSNEASGRQAPESVELSIESSDGGRKTLSLSPSGPERRVYQALVSDLAPGSYRAVLTRPTEASPPSVEFAVTAPPGEQANLRADQEAMRYLAEHSRGRFYNRQSAAQVFKHLPTGKPTRLGVLPSRPVWNSPWIALLFVVLITWEWLLRRRVRML